MKWPAGKFYDSLDFAGKVPFHAAKVLVYAAFSIGVILTIYAAATSDTSLILVGGCLLLGTILTRNMMKRTKDIGDQLLEGQARLENKMDVLGEKMDVLGEKMDGVKDAVKAGNGQNQRNFDRLFEQNQRNFDRLFEQNEALLRHRSGAPRPS